MEKYIYITQTLIRGKQLWLSDKVDFGAKQNHQRQRGTSYNDKNINSLRRYSNHKCVCTKQQNGIICGTNMDRAGRRNRQIHNLGW